MPSRLRTGRSGRSRPTPTFGRPVWPPGCRRRAAAPSPRTRGTLGRSRPRHKQDIGFGLVDEHPTPGETKKARDDRELIELLTEIRVVIPGVQVLFAFLFAAPFASGWSNVSHLQSRVFLAAFLCAAAATALLIAPTTYHRLTFRRGRREKDRLLRFANLAVLAGTFMLAIA